MNRSKLSACDICGKEYKLCSLKSHIDAEHKGIKYPCDQCGYEATRKENLLHEEVKYEVKVNKKQQKKEK